ncbi:hypothetical protein C9J48_16520 [Photobacterium profundum]|uniref:Uncharacterized protein n=1 Tax=Photobacterium profundum 3TCK TaxID=314280 RepID=Q1Z029_9GAMM|nr:hypothetical protein [Photobacterium profundum]EAS41842.1 hypothetical protein P3TCK_00125 [Photobacterium profundum 3TCK]PSV61227.1 hypothetical protein C9J48_16520 [Photobacterium profundum]
MDIERFAPNTHLPTPAIIASLPTTVEMTGFSDQRHYLEQQTNFSRRHHSTDDSELWVNTLDSEH